MTALANTLEQLASANSEQSKVFNEAVIDEYQYLLEMANDVYVASLETHLASMDCFGLQY